MLVPDVRPNLVVCWGGHSISRVEYEYTKEVGYHLGLRGLDICTGCGPGAMKGPMKGAAIGHVKQRNSNPRYVGLTEPGIIAAEPPNPMVNHLVVLPDIEKRLEAFVRMGHGIVVFPGGVGTAEEVLYLLGLLMDPANAEQKFPVIFTGPRIERRLFRQPRSADHADVRRRRTPSVSNRRSMMRRARRNGLAARSARCKGQRRTRAMRSISIGCCKVFRSRAQQPFVVNHENVAALQLRRDMPAHDLAFNLRRAFSAIVTGNVKDHGIRMIREHGPFVLHGDRDIMNALEKVLGEFVAQGRMKLPGAHYESCFTLRCEHSTTRSTSARRSG